MNAKVTATNLDKLKKWLDNIPKIAREKESTNVLAFVFFVEVFFLSSSLTSLNQPCWLSLHFSSDYGRLKEARTADSFVLKRAFISVLMGHEAVITNPESRREFMSVSQPDVVL